MWPPNTRALLSRGCRSSETRQPPLVIAGTFNALNIGNSHFRGHATVMTTTRSTPSCHWSRAARGSDRVGVPEGAARAPLGTGPPKPFPANHTLAPPGQGSPAATYLKGVPGHIELRGDKGSLGVIWGKKEKVLRSHVRPRGGGSGRGADPGPALSRGRFCLLPLPGLVPEGRETTSFPASVGTWLRRGRRGAVFPEGAEAPGPSTWSSLGWRRP